MQDKDFKILIVDDSESIRDMMRNFIKNSAEYQLNEEVNGQRALDYLDKNEVHLIITDIVMPDLDGLSLLKKMKYKKPEVPIIVISGYDSEDNIVMSHKYYAEKFFSKPFEWDDLLQCIKKSKIVYEESIMSKQIPEIMGLETKIEINFTNSKMIRFITDKIIKLLSTLYLVSYDKGTELYVLISEIFMLGKILNKDINKENSLYFSFVQNKFDLQFQLYDKNEEISMLESVSNNKNILENLEKYADKIDYSEDGKKVIVIKAL